MAFDPRPSGYFNGINVTGVVGGVTGVFIPYSALESFNYNVAVSGSGDIRQLIYSFLDGVADKYSTLATADKSSQMTVLRTITIPSETTMKKSYTISLNTSIPTTSVLAEPTG